MGLPTEADWRHPFSLPGSSNILVIVVNDLGVDFFVFSGKMGLIFKISGKSSLNRLLNK